MCKTIYSGSGSPTVDAIGNMRISGNMIPDRWYETMKRENGKPYFLAMQILSEIVYCYKPAPLKDDRGNVIGYRKKFDGDLLQRSYAEFQEKYTAGRETIRKALCFLEKLGVIRRELRTLKKGKLEKKIPNVMYIDLIPEGISRITCTDNQVGDAVSPLAKKETIPSKNGTPSPTKIGEGIPQNVETNTKNTTEMTNKEEDHPIYPVISQKEIIVKEFSEKMDEIKALREIVSENIGYTIVRERYTGDERRRYDEIYELICDVVCKSGGTVRIGGEDLPLQLVKGQFLKLNDSHIEYVMSCLDRTVTRIKNMRSYLLTTLYRSLQTFQNSINKMVNHGQYDRQRSYSRDDPGSCRYDYDKLLGGA